MFDDFALHDDILEGAFINVLIKIARIFRIAINIIYGKNYLLGSNYLEGAVMTESYQINYRCPPLRTGFFDLYKCMEPGRFAVVEAILGPDCEELRGMPPCHLSAWSLAAKKLACPAGKQGSLSLTYRNFDACILASASIGILPNSGHVFLLDGLERRILEEAFFTPPHRLFVEYCIGRPAAKSLIIRPKNECSSHSPIAECIELFALRGRDDSLMNGG